MIQEELSPEYQKQSREADKQDRELLEACQALERNPAWQFLSERIRAMASNKASSLLEPISGMDGVPKQEYDKGTIKGMLLVADLPSVTIALMTGANQADETSGED